MSSQTQDKIYEREDGSQRAYSKQVFETLKMAYKPFWYRILLVLAAGFIGRLILLGTSNVIGLWADQVGAQASRHFLSPWFEDFSSNDFVFLLLGMTALGFFLTLLFRAAFSRLSAQAVSQIYDEVTWRVSRYPMTFLDRTPVGRVVTRFSSDYGNVFRLFGGPLAEFIAIAFDLFATLILLALASPIYLALGLIYGAANYFVFKWNQKELRERRRNLSASRSPSVAHFAETAQGATTIRSFSKEDSFKDRFGDLDQFFLAEKSRMFKRLMKFIVQMNGTSALLFLVLGVVSFSLLGTSWVSLGGLGVGLALVVLAGNSTQLFFEWMAQFEEALVGVERMDRYLRQDLEPGAVIPSKSLFFTHPEHQKTLDKVLLGECEKNWNLTSKASIEIKNLWFKYEDHQPWILQDINFKIEAGEHLGIVGSTGSGKSTLIQLLYHLYPVQKGQILLNNMSLNLDQPEALGSLDVFRKSLSYISQDPVLFAGSLRENLWLSSEGKNPQARDEEMVQALHQVGLSQWLLGPDRGLDRKIEERGKNLSAGERQLICLARCLLQRSPVVVMDEATSSVDPQSEEIMVQATTEHFKNRTLILIAHRLSTLSHCDRILWLEKGRVKAFGPRESVLKELTSS